MEKVSEKELFETVPVHKVVATLAIPTITSQIVRIMYNLESEEAVLFSVFSERNSQMK